MSNHRLFYGKAPTMSWTIGDWRAEKGRHLNIRFEAHEEQSPCFSLCNLCLFIRLIHDVAFFVVQPCALVD
jgi:hypothetical protein